MDTLEFHPLSDTWPLLEGEDFDNLALDVAANGLKMPIMLYQGKILDGRNRYRACLEAGTTPHFETYVGDDAGAKKMVLSLNEHRRHLTLAQRQAAVKKLIAECPGKSTRQIAAEAKVDHVTVINTKNSVGELHQPNKVTGKDGKSYKARRLSDSERAERDKAIEKAFLAGSTLRELGDQYDLSPSTVGEMLQGRGISRDSRKKPAPRQRGLPVAARVPEIDISKRRVLTREQVDPEFQGTSRQFVEKYGHVQLETAEERASNRFRELSLHIKQWSKDEYLPSEIDINWLRSPKQKDVDRFLAAYEKLAVVFDNIKDIKAKIDELKGGVH